MSEALRILPLGGCGEIGLNATLLISGADALLIDCGILLGIDDAPGVDSAVPDFGPLAELNLLGVVLTHGHEDHIGAIPRLLGELEVPVHGPRFAIELLRAKLEHEPTKLARLHTVPMGARLNIGPFEVEWVHVTHSIPDSAALHVVTPAGRVVHSGDFKLDRDPIDGKTTDVERLRAIGELGVDLLLADSTNSERGGRTRAEREVGLEIDRSVAEAEGLVIVACFASHVHRLQNIVNAARRAGRRIALAGRAMENVVALAHREGYLEIDRASLVELGRVHQLDRDRVLVLATGTQGEGRAALAKMVLGDGYAIQPEPGDRLILSSMIIPGNALPVRRVVNGFARAGVEVIDDRCRGVHCSGHAHRDEQRELLEILRPRRFVPVHGDRAMLEAHARTARAAGVEEVLVIEDGESVVLAGGRLGRGPRVAVGPRYVDGSSGALIDAAELNERRKVGFAGIALCSVTLSPDGRPLGRPKVSLSGIPGGAAVAGSLEAEVENALAVVKRRGEVDREDVVFRALRRGLARLVGTKPLIQVHLHVVGG